MTRAIRSLGVCRGGVREGAGVGEAVGSRAGVGVAAAVVGDTVSVATILVMGGGSGVTVGVDEGVAVGSKPNSRVPQAVRTSIPTKTIKTYKECLIFPNPSG
jgi:hypothetical protein